MAATIPHDRHLSMSDTSKSSPYTGERPKAPWSDLLREGHALYTVLLILGTLLQAIQILVIAIIMPTIVNDIGGTTFFTWASMSYAIGSIVGAAGVSPTWRVLGARQGYTVSGFVFLLGTIGSAMSPDMATLIVVRAIQGVGGGLIVGGSVALIGALFHATLRTRILALYQGSWTISHLFGPVVGGVFAEIGWWRGSFWVMVPLTIVFIGLAWWRVPAQLETESRSDGISFRPLVRLGILAIGVLAVASAGPVDTTGMRLTLLTGAVVLIWWSFRLDHRADERLFPARAISLATPIGLALWILFLTGITQQSVVLFLPLLLQVVHGVTPLLISYVTIVISVGWTVGTFTVSGWSGAKERFALWIGPILMFAGLVGITITAQQPLLAALTGSAFILGLGIGTHNVHLISRAMATAEAGEERLVGAAMTSVRSLGGAFGAAIAGMLANIGGLQKATDAADVGDVVTFVYSANLLPLALTAIFMFMLLRLTQPPSIGRAASLKT